jgi:hypothetical protein
MTENDDFEKAISFINDIGIEIKFTRLTDQECFLPGLLIDRGCILVDTINLQSPGDILHEAAHISLTHTSERKTISADEICKSMNREAEEMACIAWSYAACIYLEIDPHFVFHSKGYKGNGETIVEDFNSGKYSGVPVLQWFNMTDEENYPSMTSWQRN